MKKKIISILLIIIIIFLLVLMLFNNGINNKELNTLNFSYENKLGDKYIVKAYLESDLVKNSHVTLVCNGKDKTEKQAAAKYQYELLLKQNDIYKELKLNKDNEITYSIDADQSTGKTKDQIEKYYTKIKIYKNFKWIK